MNRSEGSHKKKLNQITKTWGKVKFRPPAFKSRRPEIAPDPQPTAKPWQHVKNDIIDDSEEAISAERLNVESAEAKEFMQQREKNHRRNIIEAKRGEATTWESFEDEPAPAKGKKQKTQKNVKMKATFGECEQGELPTDVKNFTFKERNFFRRKLTMGLSVASKNHSIDQATNDLRRNGVLSHGTAKFQDSDPQQGNPFHKKRFQGKKRPHKKGKVSK